MKVIIASPATRRQYCPGASAIIPAAITEAGPRAILPAMPAWMRMHRTPSTLMSRRVMPIVAMLYMIVTAIGSSIWVET